MNNFDIRKVVIVLIIIVALGILFYQFSIFFKPNDSKDNRQDTTIPKTTVPKISTSKPDTLKTNISKTDTSKTDNKKDENNKTNVNVKPQVESIYPGFKNSLIISAKTNVGPITPNTSEADLVKLYGADEVKRESIYVGEGKSVIGTVLFGNSVNFLKIEWKNNFSNPERITISNLNSQWRTEEGIKIGTTLEEVERINGSVFILTGFDWDYPGRTVSWEGGKLPPQLQLDFTATQNIPMEEYKTVQGDKKIRSDNQVIRKLALKVSRIYVRW